MRGYALLPVTLVALSIGLAAAETAPAQNPAGANCATADQNGDQQNLSDKLAESRGVICPPTQLDPSMQKRPPAGGAIDVIPPPGSPGGDPKVQPK